MLSCTSRAPVPGCCQQTESLGASMLDRPELAMPIPNVLLIDAPLIIVGNPCLPCVEIGDQCLQPASFFVSEPKPFISGTAIHKRTRLSKIGNAAYGRPC